MATPSKTDDTVILTHQGVTHPGTVKGTAIDVSTKFHASVYLYHALVEGVVNTDPGIFRVRVSPSTTGDEDWVDAYAFTANADSSSTEALTASEPAGETVIAVASTSGYASNALVYVQDTGTLVNSEWARVKSIISNTSITLVDGLTNAKDSSDVLWSYALSWWVGLDLLGVSRLQVIFQHEGAVGANVEVRGNVVYTDSIS